MIKIVVIIMVLIFIQMVWSVICIIDFMSSFIIKDDFVHNIFMICVKILCAVAIFLSYLYLKDYIYKKIYSNEKANNEEDNSDLSESENNKYVLEESDLVDNNQIIQNEMNVVHQIKRYDKHFNDEIFIKRAHNIALEMIKTRMVKNHSAKYVSDLFKNNVHRVDLPIFYSFEKSENYFIIKLRLKEYKKDSSSEEKGSLISTYEMTFARSSQDQIHSRKCPRCGAPLKEKSYGICKYCFKYSDSKSSKKIKSNVVKIPYDVPVIDLGKIVPENCINCGAPLKKELDGFCEYCKGDNKAAENKWVLVRFEIMEKS